MGAWETRRAFLQRTCAAFGEIAGHPGHHFVQADIGDGATMLETMRTHAIDAIMHLAAESHVDRSIDGPAVFVETNVLGTFKLLEAALTYWRGLDADRRERLG